LLKDGQTCATNAQCEHVCRWLDSNESFTQKACATRGGYGDHCDENADCTTMPTMLVCRTASGDVGPHCNTLAPALSPCDESADCDQTTASTCTDLGTGKICVPVGGSQGGGGQGGGNSGGPGGG
jgi:hypothetical protein